MISHFTRYSFLLIFLLFSAVFSADYFYQKKQNEYFFVPLNESIESIRAMCAYKKCNLGSEFGKISILSRKSLIFPTSLELKLDNSEVIQVSNKDNLFFAYATSSDPKIIIRYGPFTYNDFDEDFWYTSIFYSLLALAIFAGLFPLFREMSRLKQSAELFAQSGELSALPTGKSAFFKPVNIAFATMVTKIARLLALQKELSDTLSHEIRTPLSRIRFSQRALNKDTIEQFKQDMDLDLDEMESLVEEYLVFSSLDHEEQALETKLQSPLPIIEKHVLLFNKYTNKDVSFSHQGTNNTCIEINEQKFSRAIKNLIDNACKYTKSKVLVTIIDKKEDDNIFIFIEDDGSGIKVKNIDDLFLPYTRMTKTTISGFGLGLAITRKIILWHGGEISVGPSNTLGGACFCIKIPYKK